MLLFFFFFFFFFFLKKKIQGGCSHREINVSCDPSKNFFASKPHPVNVDNVYSITESEILLHDIRYSKHPLLSIYHNYGDRIPHGIDITTTNYPDQSSGN